jgi:homoserine kinase
LAAVQALGVAGAISGAGPAMIAFADVDQASVTEIIRAAFAAVGCSSRYWYLETAAGALCETT